MSVELRNPQNCQRGRIDPLEPLQLFVFPSPHSPTGLIMQTEGIFLANSQRKSITPYLDMIATIILKGRECVQQLTGQDPCLICTTLTSKELKHSLQNSLSWQLALADYVGQIDNHYPDLPVLQFLKQTRMNFT